MKIYVRSDNTNIKFWIPNSLIFSGLVRKQLITQIYRSSKGNIPFPPAVMNTLFLNMKNIANEYKGLNLVEVYKVDCGRDSIFTK